MRVGGFGFALSREGAKVKAQENSHTKGTKEAVSAAGLLYLVAASPMGQRGDCKRLCRQRANLSGLVPLV